MITVTFVHHSLKSGGGSERVIYQLITGLDRRRFRPVLCCLYAPGEWGESLRDMGCTIHSDLMRRRYDVRGVPAVARILKHEKTDILYVSDGLLNMVVGRAAAGLAKTPFTALGFHSYDTIIRRRASRTKRTMLGLLDLAYHPRFSAYIALAPSHKRYLVECKGLPAEKVVVAYNGVDLGEFNEGIDRQQWREASGVPADAKVVVMVAGLRRWKAHDVLLKAAARLLPEIPDLHFLLAGDGSQRANLEQLAVDLGIDHNVHFLGNISDVVGLLKSADLVVLSSEHEAFPLSLLEAMAAERPIVATNVGSVPEMIEDGVNGYIVEVGAVDEFAIAMLRVLESPERGRALGQAGRRIVEDRFRIEDTVSRYESIFQEWVETGPSRFGEDGGTR